MVTQMKPNYVEELVKLKELREQGALSEVEFTQAKAEVLQEMTVPAAPATVTVPAAPAEDVIGTGRYILSFILAGLIGLGIAYWLRKRGWLAIWINAAIGVVAWMIVLSA